MPTMYRPGGVSHFFRTREEGQKAGFFDSYSDVVAACEAAQRDGSGKIEPQAVQERPPAPPVAPAPDDRPQPPKPPQEPPSAVSADDIDELPLENLRALAADLGMDVSVHHRTLRKQVKEHYSNAQSRDS